MKSENRYRIELKCGCVLVAEGVKIIEHHLCKKCTAKYLDIVSAPQYRYQLRVGLVPKNRPKIVLYKESDE